MSAPIWGHIGALRTPARGGPGGPGQSARGVRALFPPSPVGRGAGIWEEGGKGSVRPSRRERWYIYAVKTSTDAVAKENQGPSWLKEVAPRVKSMAVSTPVPLSSFLLPDDHEVLAAWRRDCEQVRVAREDADAKRKAIAKGPPKKKAKAKAATNTIPVVKEVEAWEQEHMEIYGHWKLTLPQLTWPPDLSQETHLLNLPRRQQELAYLVKYITKDGVTRVDDLNMSTGFNSPGEDLTPCIVASSTIWLTSSTVNREIHGSELLAIQGFSHQRQMEVLGMKHSELTDLAGNAFCGFTFVALLISLLSAVGAMMEEQMAQGQQDQEDAQEDAIEVGSMSQSVSLEDPDDMGQDLDAESLGTADSQMV